MIMIFRRRASSTIALAVAGIALLGLPSKSHAVLTLRVLDSSNNVIFTATDGVGGPTGDQDTTNGTLTLANGLSVAGFLVNGSFNTSNANFAIPGTPLDTSIGRGLETSGSSTVINTNLGAPTTLTVELSDTNFGAFGRPVIATTTTSGTFANGATGSALGSSVASTFFIDPTNTLFGTGAGTLINAFTGTSTGLTTDSFSNNGGPFGPFVPGGGLFSITERFIITLTANSSLTSRGNNIAVTALVPEPATLAMACGALPFIGISTWRRLRRKAS